MHRRVTDILQDYWSDLKGERSYPSYEEVKEDFLKKEGVWDDSFIMEVFPLTFKNGFRKIYIGENLGEEFELNDSGKFVKNLVLNFLESSADKYEEVVQTKKPMVEARELDGKDGQQGIKYRQILLPLGEGDEVTHILGGMRFINSKAEEEKG